MSGTLHRLLTRPHRDARAGRVARLREAFAGRADALIVSNGKDIEYLTGFVGHDSLLLVGTGFASIISDPRYDEFLNPWREAGEAEIIMGVRHRLLESVKAVCRERGLRRVALQTEHVTLDGRSRIVAALGDDAIVETSGLVARLRMSKDNVEIDAIKRAIAIQQQALAAALGALRPGMTELQFSALLEYEMKTRGSSGASFEPIIGAGANSSVIHYMTGDDRIGEGALLVDWGARVDGYCSDMTRTFAVGSTPAKIREIYRVVFEAQAAAIDAIAPGKTCAEIDAVARDMITRAGFGEYFGHGLGHGLGMDVHEPPFFNSLSADVLLEPGMVMTVEPGIYLPGIGGVRIEDDVLVTRGGCRVLSDYPKGLDDVVIDFAAAPARVAEPVS